MTFLWYDLETFGRNPQHDRISQFAAVRTNEQFEIIEEPVILYGKISPDYLPDPMSCLLTGITPLATEEKGLTEAGLIKEIDKHFSQPGTCVLGFNSLRFDDEFIRNLYYRNFYDPYLREWSGGNSRWDIIDLVRAARDLRPQGIQWPFTQEGKPTVKLESLSQANNLAHEQAHDALSDVTATIAVAKLIREKQPKLFQWAFSHRTKEQIRPLIDLVERSPLVHTSGMFCRPEGCTTLVAPVTVDPARRNTIYSFDLRWDPGPLLELPAAEIRRRVFTRREELEAQGIERIPLKGIHLNKSPFLAPCSVLDKSAAQALDIDLELCEERRQRLKKSEDLIGKVWEVFNSDFSPSYGDKGSSGDPDLQIYGNFFPDEDKALLTQIRQTPSQDLPGLRPQGRDPRIPEMLRRYVGRNFPEVLGPEQQKQWKSFCASRILFPPLPGASDLGEYRKRLASWRESEELEASKKLILKDLETYGDRLEKELLGA